ncbi:agmatinase [Paenibacillus pini JCM 16418]|uniref:Agmatinase n=1 Tax=Paenibacillus pini JCM 16418 TaxID=1236976 RepID=W7Z7S2_9BACL|nr:agmatinase [Paenibacillus pini JCM 16418]
MKLDQAYSGNVFICSSENYESSKAVIYGMPMDYTVSFRPGSRFGPSHIRQASVGLEEYSPYLDKSIVDLEYFDAGDLLLPFGNAARSLKSLANMLVKFLQTTSSLWVLVVNIWLHGL